MDKSRTRQAMVHFLSPTYSLLGLLVIANLVGFTVYALLQGPLYAALLLEGLVSLKGFLVIYVPWIVIVGVEKWFWSRRWRAEVISLRKAICIFAVAATTSWLFALFYFPCF